MKHQILLMALSKWKSLESKTKKKLLIFAGLFTAVTVALGVFALVMVFKAGVFLFDKTLEIGQGALTQAPAIVGQPLDVPAALPQINSAHLLKCSDKLQSLLSLDPWINAPLSQTFDSVMASCFAAPKEATKDPSTESAPDTQPETAGQ